jgi:uncharacterized protein
MTDYRQKRANLEQRSRQTLLHYGKIRFYLEDFEPLLPVLKAVLFLTGTLGRGRRNALDLQLRKLEFFFDDLPPAFSGYRILFFSDIHVDGLPAIPANAAKLVSQIEADLCILGGDYRFQVYGPSRRVLDGMEQIIRSIKSHDGIFGILGNHDFAEIGAGLEKLGVRMLMNEAVELRRGAESVWLAGLDDPHFYRCGDIAGATSAIPVDAGFKIVAVHTPELYREAEALGYRLYLSGHTHGGQICAPGGKPIIVHARCPRGFARGNWHYRTMTGYTSTGVGASLLPVRFNCPPEVVLLTLRRQSK